jgi:ubiquinone/menaquinone biosynthesis C-methylase UbiE
MNDLSKKNFDEVAQTWDSNRDRVVLAEKIVGEILRKVPVTKDMVVLDYGAGTGLVSLGLAEHLKAILAADSSADMLTRLDEKAAASKIHNVRTLHLDLEHDTLPDERFDLVLCTMTLHHIDDAAGMIAKLASLLRTGGWLALADLDLDGGEFHSDNTGVRYHGFDRAFMNQAFAEAGLADISITTAHKILKDVISKQPREFPIFLAVGHR